MQKALSVKTSDDELTVSAMLTHDGYDPVR